MSVTAAKPYDVTILGTGIGGTILGAILAKHGLKVMLVERGTHPRFAIGESTIPETTFFFRLLAQRYGVPEIGHLSSYQLVHRHVGSTSGVKRNFSFVHHRRDEPQRPSESLQFPTAAPPLGPDVHLFRQDVDAYMLAVAVRYGASVRLQTEVTDISFQSDAVHLRTRGGDTIATRFLVDAGGIKSMLARLLGLRQEPCPLATRSRTLYTHMIGVKPYDACAGSPAGHGLASPLSQGTLQHTFERGWVWVIPFNNHPTSTNPLVSVGLTLDIDHYPAADLPPGEEFRQIIRPYPKIVEQFADAAPVREWVGTERLQFSSTRAIGDRFAMLPHAFSFVDPLFSSGLNITMCTINLLADRLLRAAADGDFSAARFADVDAWMKRSFRHYDRLVSGCYAAFSSFELWNAWLRLWMLGGLYGGVGVLEMFHRFQQAARPTELTVCEEPPYRGVLGCDFAPFAALFDAAERELDAVRAGACAPAEAATRIFRLVNESGLWPEPWGEASPEKRCPATFTLWPMLRTGLWMRRRAPLEVRKYYFKSARVSSLLAYAAQDWCRELRHAASGVATLTRDLLLDWNRDWAR